MPETIVPVNEQLLDFAIAHAHAIERFKTGEVQKILKFLNTELYPDLLDRMASQVGRIKSRGYRASERRLKQLEDHFLVVDGIVRTSMGEAFRDFRSDLFSFAKLDSQWQIGRMRSAVPPGLVSFSTPSPEILRSVVVSRPFQGKILKDHFATLTRNIREAYRSQLRLGMAQGESIEQLTRRVRGRSRAPMKGGAVAPQSRREVRSIVRTAVNHVSTHAREETFRANSDVVKQVRYVATLDARTTDICMSLDGKVFLIDEGPRPPMHHQCRSTVVPILVSWQELGIDPAKVPVGTRASMNGQVPADITYGQWLRKQPAHIQNEALGVERANLFRQGLPIEKFVDSEYRSLSLSELRRLVERQ